MEWRDRVYKETLEAVLAGLEARKRTDPGFTRADAEGTLKHLYIQEGHDYGARGIVQDAATEATIAAHEQFIDIWKAADAQAFDRSSP